MQELMTKKKKKKNETFILGNVYNSNEEILESEISIERKIMTLFKNHIGIGNSISPSELFYKIYGIYPQELNVYKRVYWYDLIKKELRALRRANKLFTIIKGSKIFVLSDKMELEYYLKKSDRHIASIENLKSNARKWISQGKWRYI